VRGGGEERGRREERGGKRRGGWIGGCGFTSISLFAKSPSNPEEDGYGGRGKLLKGCGEKGLFICSFLYCGIYIGVLSR